MYKISASLLLRNAQYHCLNSTGTVLKLTFELDLLCHTLLINIYTPAGMLAKQFDRARKQISFFPSYYAIDLHKLQHGRQIKRQLKSFRLLSMKKVYPVQYIM